MSQENADSSRTLRRTTSNRAGVIAGVLGGSAVALFFVVTNALLGRPLLETPALLGTLVVHGPEAVISGNLDTSMTMLLGYTAAHFAAFMTLGLGLAWLMRRVVRTPQMGAFAILLFAILQGPFFAVITAFGQQSGLTLPAAEIALANVLATLTMVGYLFAAMPALRRRFRDRSWAWAFTANYRRARELRSDFLNTRPG